MSVTKDKLKAENLTFFAACRENTGMSMCDSGGDGTGKYGYGRWHERPEIDPNGPAITLDTYRDNTGIMASLSTPHYLDARYEIDRDLQAKFDVWEAEHPDSSWFEAGREFMENLKFEQMQRGNTYNGEQDLTQSVIYEVWKPEDQKEDGDSGIYAVDGIRTVVYVHTGCDERSGHSRPVFCKSRNDYAIPVDYVVGFSFSNGRRGRRKLTQEECQSYDERYQVGYTGAPSFELSKDLEKVWAVKDNTFKVKLKTGETFDVHAYFNEE